MRAMPPRRPPLRESRGLRLAAGLVAGALLLGALLGSEAGGDVRSSFAAGRITRPSLVEPVADAAPTSAAEDDAAISFGFAAAAAADIRHAVECARLRPEFRRGCERYVSQRPAEGRLPL